MDNEIDHDLFSYGGIPLSDDRLTKIACFI